MERKHELIQLKRSVPFRTAEGTIITDTLIIDAASGQAEGFMSVVAVADRSKNPNKLALKNSRSGRLSSQSVGMSMMQSTRQPSQKDEDISVPRRLVWNCPREAVIRHQAGFLNTLEF